MDLLANVLGLEVLRHRLWHQMTAIGGGIHQQVLTGAGNRTIKNHLKRLVPRVGSLEREVIAKHDESLRSPCHQIGNFCQVDQVTLVDLDQTQALTVVLVQHGLDQRTLAGATGTGEQNVIGTASLDILSGVVVDQASLTINPQQIGGAYLMRMRHRLQRAAPAKLAPAKSDGIVPAHRRGQGRQPQRELLQHLIEPLQQRCQFGAIAGLCRLSFRCGIRH